MTVIDFVECAFLLNPLQLPFPISNSSLRVLCECVDRCVIQYTKYCSSSVCHVLYAAGRELLEVESSERIMFTMFAIYLTTKQFIIRDGKMV